MFVPDDRFPQIAGIRADQIVPVESAASGGNSGSSTPTQCAAAQSAAASGLQQYWGAPRIHGELLMLGIDVGQTTVAKYMVRPRRAPSQGWKTFLRNHTDGIASVDLFVVPTISFRLLYGLLILQHRRRVLLWLGVTAHPTTEWIARQLTEAYAWEQTPRYLIRDRDGAYDDVLIRRLRAMGIRD
jgi:hypothetical protein